jgi:hypothetical protein
VTAFTYEPNDPTTAATVIAKTALRLDLRESELSFKRAIYYPPKKTICKIGIAAATLAAFPPSAVYQGSATMPFGVCHGLAGMQIISLRN